MDEILKLLIMEINQHEKCLNKNLTLIFY